MNDQASHETGFHKKEGWAAFDQLFWSKEPERIKEIAAQINEYLSEDPIQILVLGIGCGTFEVPLLAQIKNIRNKSVKIIGIDYIKEALNVTSYLLINLDNLPLTNQDKAIQLEEQWKTRDEDVWQVEDHLMVWDNLDFEENKTENDKFSKAYQEILDGFPSNWKKRLEKVLKEKGYQEKFDIIISSFCLHHLTWWRCTLINSLSLLKEKGLFVFNWVEGDSEIMIGNLSSSPQILNLPENHQHQEYPYDNYNFKHILDKFFDSCRNNHYASSRAIGSVNPFQIKDFLDLFRDYGLEKIVHEKSNNSENYLILNSVNKSAIISLIKLKFCSPFEMASNFLGEYIYQKIVDDIEKESEVYLSPISSKLKNPTDNLLFKCNWTAYQLTDQKKFLESFLYKQFQLEKSNTYEKYQDKNIFFDYYKLLMSSENYGLMESLKESQFMGEFAKFVNTSGILQRSLIGGFIRYHDEQVVKNPLFLNYLHKIPKNWDNYTKDIWLNMLLRKPEFNKSNVTNVDTLVKKLIPELGKPIVMIYQLESENYSVDKSKLIDIKLEPCFSCFIIRYVLSKRLKTVEQFEDEFEQKYRYRLEHPVAFKKIISSQFIYECDYSEVYQKQEDDINQLRELIKNYIETNKIVNDSRAIIQKEIASCPEIFRDLFEKTLDFPWAEKAIFANLFCQYSTLVFVPIYYYLDFQADSSDSILLFFDRNEKQPLTIQQIESNLKAVNVFCEYIYTDMFKEEKAKQDASMSILHQLPKDLASLDISLIDHQRKLGKFAKQLKKQYPDLDLEVPILTKPESLGIMLMFSKASQSHELIELPKDCAQILYGEWNQATIEEFINRVVWKQSIRRVSAYEGTRDKMRGFNDDEIIKRYPKPILIIEPEKFKLKNNPHGIYPLMLLALRSAYQHSYLMSVLEDTTSGQITIKYNNSDREELWIFNTGYPPNKFSNSQGGWEKDVKLFKGLSGNWELFKLTDNQYSIYENGYWVTKIIGNN